MDADGATPSDACDLVQSQWPESLFLCFYESARKCNCVYLHIGFLEYRLDFIFRVAAMIVAAVGDHNNCFARIPGVFLLLEGEIHRVPKRGEAVWLCGIHNFG